MKQIIFLFQFNKLKLENEVIRVEYSELKRINDNINEEMEILKNEIRQNKSGVSTCIEKEKELKFKQNEIFIVNFVNHIS